MGTIIYYDFLLIVVLTCLSEYDEERAYEWNLISIFDYPIMKSFERKFKFDFSPVSHLVYNMGQLRGPICSALMCQ